MAARPAPPTLWRGDGREQAGLARRIVPPPDLTGAAVRVRGLTAVGAAVAVAAARAGAARVSLADRRFGDPEPGTVPRASRGTRAQRTARQIAGLCPDVRIDLDASRRVDAEAVVGYGAIAPPVVHGLMVDDRPHVALLVDDAGVESLPVRPGATACLRCRDLDRTARDPAWPVVARQCEAHEPFTDPVTAAVAGALAAAGLAALVAGADPPAWRVEAGMPARTPFPARPGCGCGAA